ncbi:hypothetical protein MTO96_039715 [Rhipicephalus appendiculatus]
MIRPKSLCVFLVCLVCVQALWWDVWPKCWKRKLVGNCSQKIPSWYYSFWSGRCKGFLYSGCGGKLKSIHFRRGMPKSVHTPS